MAGGTDFALVIASFPRAARTAVPLLSGASPALATPRADAAVVEPSMPWNLTAEQLSALLRLHNLTRAQFIARYGLRPLVLTPQLPARARLALLLTGLLIFTLALFGNALVVYVVTRSKAMRTVTNIFICSLALSDLLIVFFCIPVTMLQNVSDTWLGGKEVLAVLSGCLLFLHQEIP